MRKILPVFIFSFLTFSAVLFIPNLITSVFATTGNVDDHFASATVVDSDKYDDVKAHWTYQFAVNPGNQALARSGMVHYVQLVRLGINQDYFNSGGTYNNTDPDCSSVSTCQAFIESYLQTNLYGFSGMSGDYKDPALSHYYIIGNDPNNTAEDGVSGTEVVKYSRYARQYQAVYQAIKAKDPIAKIIGPSTLGWSQFLNGRDWYGNFVAAYKTTFSTSNPPPMDYASIHLYDINTACSDYSTPCAAPGTILFRGLDTRIAKCELSSAKAAADGISCSTVLASPNNSGDGFREWLNGNDYPTTPIWITQFGVLACDTGTHDGFTWSCTANNDSSMIGYIKPKIENLVDWFHGYQSDLKLEKWSLFEGVDESAGARVYPISLVNTSHNLTDYGTSYAAKSNSYGTPIYMGAVVGCDAGGQGSYVKVNFDKLSSSNTNYLIYHKDAAGNILPYNGGNVYNSVTGKYDLPRTMIALGSSSSLIYSNGFGGGAGNGATINYGNHGIRSNTTYTFYVQTSGDAFSQTSPYVTSNEFTVTTPNCAEPSPDISVAPSGGLIQASHQTLPAVYRQSDGTFYPAGASSTQLGGSGDIPVPADYSGDGVSDTAIFRPSNRHWFVTGSGTYWDTAFGASGDIPVPGDYNGNGSAEPGVVHNNSGTWEWSSYTGTFSSASWGYTSDVPVPGDYNGDSATDIAVFRPSDGYWYVKYASGSTENLGPLGTTGDIPVPGDYDGDGYTDLAIFRPSTGEWFVKYHAGGGTISLGVWGYSTDIPVPGDYDGNGSTDVAIYRPGDTKWYIQNNSAINPAWGYSTDKILNQPQYYIY